MAPNFYTVPEYPAPGQPGDYSIVQALYDTAQGHLRRGELNEAWEKFAEAMNAGLWIYYVEKTGKSRSQIRDAAHLLKKLNSGRHADAWTMRVIPPMVIQPEVVGRHHCEILAVAIRNILLPTE